MLLEHELGKREMRRLARHRAESMLSADKSLSAFNFSAVPTVMRAYLTALAEDDGWFESGANLLLFGPPGACKTQLVSAIGHALIDRGTRVLLTHASDLMQRLQAARRDSERRAELARLDHFDLLILDDLSYVRRDHAETSVLFGLVAERYERKSIAITTNQPFSQANLSTK